MALCLLMMAAPTFAAELVMFERPNCPFCLAWKREVGDRYPLTEEGRIAPLRVVRLDAAESHGIELREDVKYSPTFVLVEGDKEIGRILGYSSDDAFWGLLRQLVARLRVAPHAGEPVKLDEKRLR